MSEAAAMEVEKTVTELSGATRELAHQGVNFAKDMSEKTQATAQETNKAAEAVYSTFTSGAMDFRRQWIEMVRGHTNATLDFMNQMLGVKSPSAFLELSAEHARKQLEAFAEQAQHFTGMAQNLTTRWPPQCRLA